MILISTHGRLWISFLCGICQWPFTLQQLFLAGYISLNCLFFLLWCPFIAALPFAVPWKNHALSGFSCESLCFVSCMGEWSAITQEGSFLLCNARIKIARYCIKCIYFSCYITKEYRRIGMWTSKGKKQQLHGKQTHSSVLSHWVSIESVVARMSMHSTSVIKGRKGKHEVHGKLRWFLNIDTNSVLMVLRGKPITQAEKTILSCISFPLRTRSLSISCTANDMTTSLFVFL